MSPSTILRVAKLDASYNGIRMWAEFFFVLSQSMLLIDGRIAHTAVILRLHSCSAVKTKKSLSSIA